MRTMKKLNKIFVSAAIVASGAAMTSCGSDFLDITPDHSYTAPTFYTSDKAVMKASSLFTITHGSTTTAVPWLVWVPSVPTMLGVLTSSPTSPPSR